MKVDDNVSKAIDWLRHTAVPGTHSKAREILRSEKNYLQYLIDAYLNNPFLKLTEDESAALQKAVRPAPLGHLIALRDTAARSSAPKYVVFCMPKSGSTFVKSALERALQLPFVSLTGFGTPRINSHFGMNSREQELDENAIIKAIIRTPNGFVAQHHTRYSPYLALQLKYYKISPIITIRNILDCVVSFDDMMMSARKEDGNDWFGDPQFGLPLDYPDLDDDSRYTILIHSYGIWLINFYLSWKRCRRQGIISTLFLRYEDQILDPESLVKRVSGYVSMSDEQLHRLRDYAAAPDKAKSRFNVGRAGRGNEKIPQHLKIFLADYARMFRGELMDDDIRYLVG